VLYLVQRHPWLRLQNAFTATERSVLAVTIVVFFSKSVFILLLTFVV